MQEKVVRLEAVRKGPEKGNEGEMLHEEEVRIKAKKKEEIHGTFFVENSQVSHCLRQKHSKIMNLQNSQAYENRKKNQLYSYPLKLLIKRFN